VKLYVLVRADLTPSQRAVQAGHAVAEFLLKHPTTEWRNGILVYLRMRDEEELLDWLDTFCYHGHHHAFFREEDMGDQVTAAAALGVDTLVKELPLL